MKHLVWLFIPAILLIGCPKKTPDPEVPNIITKDDITMCAPACEHARSLHCFEAQDLIFKNSCETDKDCELGICKNGQCTETCEMTCKGFVEEGRQLGLECWQTIEDCREIESICR